MIKERLPHGGAFGGFPRPRKDPDAETLSRRRSYSFHFASSVDDSWNEKTAGIFALRPTGLKYVGMKNARSAIPVLRTLTRISSSVESQMLFQTRNTSGVAQRRQHQERTPAPLVEEIRAKTLKVAADV
jgi:hypothetical protein